MYNTIYVPVDNSDYSNEAIHKAVQLGSEFSSKLVGSHVYAATMHDYRFKQMEYTLPEEYLQEEEIDRQRKIHDSLITMGLELISDSYLDQMDCQCKESGIAFERKMMDGKHHVEILKDIQSSNYDLVVLGVLGVGKTRDSQIGSVCERVTRFSNRDVLVVKHIPKKKETERDTILVGIDGSPQSFGGLMTAIDLAKKFKKKIEVIGVYDPYLHYTVFNGLVDVLSEKAAKVFRFEEQNQLHEEIIDTGLAQIYQSHLNVAEGIAKEHGVEVKKTLIDGKAYQKILNHCRETNPWLLIVGRTGVHSVADEKGLGSNTENLLRLSPCDILLNTRLEYPELDLKAEESVLWTEEAEERMTRVPAMVRGIARTAILRLAIEKGHSVVTNSVVTEAMDRFMPKQTAEATEKLAEALILERSKSSTTWLCKRCGSVSLVENPAKCSVCGNKDYEVITSDAIEEILAAEGGGEEETTYDGRKLCWSREARRQLLAIEDPYQKRRAKARIEKSARMKKLDTITSAFAQEVIEDEVGQVLFDAKGERNTEDTSLTTYDGSEDKKVVGEDSDGEKVYSVFQWTDEAVERLCRVPTGFMRDKTQARVESLALERQVEQIDLSFVKEAIDAGKNMMEDFLRESGYLAPEPEEKADNGEAKCPFSAAFGETNETSTKKPVSNVHEGAVGQVLNEVGVMSTTIKRRDELGEK